MAQDKTTVGSPTSRRARGVGWFAVEPGDRARPEVTAGAPESTTKGACLRSER
jgi:hypothetical protein